ncbi:hypothetical protein [Hymenobacter metallicola]|uniref:Uncharacterized protein n=1 Tax=Hymenobacter metallicola TaxID=2563114 RepID=A0A4Z0QEF6_9BACT|nr:hypothetical protein [Hymenobacter metallicola]TGE28438.1 hypothetical protein E5K02_02940 [Hymenobacter metallicola]
MPQRPTPAPHVAGVSISSKNGLVVLAIIVILLALFGKKPTAPGPFPAPKQTPAPAGNDTITVADSRAD